MVMHKDKLIAAGFDANITDDILEDSWNTLLRFHGSEDALFIALDDAAKKIKEEAKKK